MLPVVRKTEIKIASDEAINHEYLPVLGKYVVVTFIFRIRRKDIGNSNHQPAALVVVGAD